jgi:hypothetical protein
VKFHQPSVPLFFIFCVYFIIDFFIIIIKKYTSYYIYVLVLVNIAFSVLLYGVSKRPDTKEVFNFVGLK